MLENTVIGWKIESVNIGVASVRYRCLLPVLALSKAKMRARVFSRACPSNLVGLKSLVFVKSFRPEDYALALQAFARGIPIILDLCDNIFIENYGRKYLGVPSPSRSATFIQMLDLACMVVVSTQTLADIVKSRTTVSCPIVVIPDGIETTTAFVQMGQLITSVRRNERLTTPQRISGQVNWAVDRLILLRTVDLWKFTPFYSRLLISSTKKYIKSFLNNVRRMATSWKPCLKFFFDQRQSQKLPHCPSGLQSILWFGHHGANYAKFGMADLLAIRSDLEIIGKKYPVELVVVSNSKEKFTELILPFDMPTRYVEWTSEALHREFSQATVVIIPNSRDEFSICKSANRAVLALLSGVPVVATSTPALEGLSTCIIFDDFLKGLEVYLNDSERRAVDVNVGQSIVNNLYGDQIIIDSWLNVFERVEERKFARVRSISPVLLVVLQNQLDWLILRSVVQDAVLKGISVGAVLDLRFPEEATILSVLVKEFGVTAEFLHPDRLKTFVFQSTVRVLLCASESNLLPHRLAHQITLHARRHGIYTAVIQHGYETPGLTYHDSFHSIHKVSFASERIYLWGRVQSLHPLVSRATRAKCLSVGVPGGLRLSGETSQRITNLFTIGVFENLHWLRYSAQYRQFFIRGIQCAAERYPQVRFLIRAHPLGKWLRHSNEKSLFQLPNVTIAPESNTVEGSLNQLFKSINGVITTPSTIALISAHAGLPVAVVGGGLTLDRYEPLTQLNITQDWLDFVHDILIPDDSGAVRELSTVFITRVIEPGNAECRIIEDILAHI